MTQKHSIRDWIDSLQDLFFVLEQRLQALQDELIAAGGHDQLADDLNRSAAGAVANLLGTLKNQTTPPDGNMADVQNADQIARAYIDATRWVEHLNLPQKTQLGEVLAARADIRHWLETLTQQNIDLLEQLLAESARLAKQKPLAPDEIIRHLEQAVDTLRQTRNDRDLIDPQISRPLAMNWATMLENIDTSNPPQPTNPDYLQRAADLLSIRQLLDEAYDLLAEDISADSPLDVVNI